MDWKRAWAVKTYGVRHLPLKQSELTEASNLVSWRASTVLVVVHFFTFVMRVIQALYTAAMFLRPQKVS